MCSSDLVPRGVDDVDPMLLVILIHPAPKAGGRSRGDRDAALLFLFHPVHHGRAIMDLSNFVRDAGVKKNPLGRRRLAGIDMGHDADVAITF